MWEEEDHAVVGFQMLALLLPKDGKGLAEPQQLATPHASKKQMTYKICAAAGVATVELSAQIEGSIPAMVLSQSYFGRGQSRAHDGIFASTGAKTNDLARSAAHELQLVFRRGAVAAQLRVLSLEITLLNPRKGRPT